MTISEPKPLLHSKHRMLSNVLRIIVPVLLILLLLNSVATWQMEPVPPFFFSYRITNLQFMDGGTGIDIILATAQSQREQVTITGAYVNENPVNVSGGTVEIPTGGLGTVLLTLPSGTLIPGREYDVRLMTDPVRPFYARERYIYYHMYHPDATGPVEEGVIEEIFPGYYSKYSNADCWTVAVRNTGDLPITVTGGFINGNSASNTTGHLTVEKSESEQVTMCFPAASLLDQMQKKIPFQVKVVTARDNVISYAEPYYVASPDHIFRPENVAEPGQIANLQFIDGGDSADLIVATVRNAGSAPITLTSCLLNGKAQYFIPDTLTIPKGSTGNVTIPLPSGSLIDSVTYQVVLITSHSNAFIRTSTYKKP